MAAIAGQGRIQLQNACPRLIVSDGIGGRAWVVDGGRQVRKRRRLPASSAFKLAKCHPTSSRSRRQENGCRNRRVDRRTAWPVWIFRDGGVPTPSLSCREPPVAPRTVWFWWIQAFAGPTEIGIHRRLPGAINDLRLPMRALGYGPRVLARLPPVACCRYTIRLTNPA